MGLEARVGGAGGKRMQGEHSAWDNGLDEARLSASDKCGCGGLLPRYFDECADLAWGPPRDVPHVR